MESEEDYNNGRVKDVEEVFKEWEEQYDLTVIHKCDY